MVARESTSRERPRRVGAVRAGRRALRRRSRGLQRPDVGARVRRRRVLRPRRDGVRLELRGSAALPRRPGWRAGRDHARRRRSPPSPRRREGDGEWRPLDRRPRAARGERPVGRGGQRARRHHHRRLGRTSGARRRPGLLLEPADLTGRLAALLPRLGPAVDAVGRLRAARRRPGVRRCAHEPRARRRPRRARVDLAARVEPRGRSSLRERPQRLVEPRAHSRR